MGFPRTYEEIEEMVGLELLQTHRARDIARKGLGPLLSSTAEQSFRINVLLANASGGTQHIDFGVQKPIGYSNPILDATLAPGSSDITQGDTSGVNRAHFTTSTPGFYRIYGSCAYTLTQDQYASFYRLSAVARDASGVEQRSEILDELFFPSEPQGLRPSSALRIWQGTAGFFPRGSTVMRVESSERIQIELLVDFTGVSVPNYSSGANMFTTAGNFRLWAERLGPIRD